MTGFLQDPMVWMTAHPELAVASMVLGWLAAITVLVRVLWSILRKRHRTGLWAGILKVRRWLNGHLVQLLSWLLLPILLAEIVRTYRDPSGKPHHQLVLVGLLVAAAVLAQFGNDLLMRLKKVGPVEFIEQRFERIVPELEELPSFDLSHTHQPLPKKLLHEYEKAELYVTHLEWSGLKGETARSEKFHDLLLKMSTIALYQRDWVRAADRLEILLRLSGGKFKSAGAHYRCGLAYSHWAQSSQGRAAEALFRQAQDHLWEAVTAEPYHWAAYFNLAYVQVNLRMYELARQNNEKAIEIRPRYAPAKYNLAICWIKLGNLDAALKELKLIGPEDESAERVIKTASKDGDLKPLLRDGERGPEARRFLGAFNNRSS